MDAGVDAFDFQRFPLRAHWDSSDDGSWPELDALSTAQLNDWSSTAYPSASLSKFRQIVPARLPFRLTPSVPDDPEISPVSPTSGNGTKPHLRRISARHVVMLTASSRSKCRAGDFQAAGNRWHYLQRTYRPGHLIFTATPRRATMKSQKSEKSPAGRHSLSGSPTNSTPIGVSPSLEPPDLRLLEGSQSSQRRNHWRWLRKDGCPVHQCHVGLCGDRPRAGFRIHPRLAGRRNPAMTHRPADRLIIRVRPAERK